MTLLGTNLDSRLRETGASIPPGSPLLDREPSQNIGISASLDYSVFPEDADGTLERYRRTFAPRFPFVPIATALSAHGLSLTEPFLFKVIAQVVAARRYTSNGPNQPTFHRWFRQYLADEVLLKQRKTLEMLQAILVFAAWGDYYLCGESQGSDLTQMAISLVSDIGLDRPPPPGREHTLQEQRAALGCFYIGSV